MSGPKRAEVEAQLKVAHNGQRKCANRIANAEKKALQSLLNNAEILQQRTNSIVREAEQSFNSLSSELRLAAGDSLNGLRLLIQEAQRFSAETDNLLGQTRSSIAQADDQETTANVTHQHANRVYDEAESALRNAGSHYLRREMQQAEAATNLFNQAERELANASRSRGNATQHASQATRFAEEAASAAQNALRTFQATRAEAEARQRAAEEAKRIAEEKQRNATMALEGARATCERVLDLPHAKFSPGAEEQINRALEGLAQLMSQSNWDEASSTAKRLEQQARQLEVEIRTAQQEHTRRRAEAEASLQHLTSALEGTDIELIRDWADDSQALNQVQTQRQAAQAAMDNEEFEKAGEQAQAARETLMRALHTAAQNKSRHEVRGEIGEAVMDVLEELGFDVSTAEGTRTEPLRIAGQTPETSGRGDFDVSIPLSGEVNFHVNTPDGDTSCVAAVQELQKRLAERGVEWNTTDWGHAEGAQHGGITQTMQTTETMQQSVKMTSRS
jgi:hypothetical protein